MEDRQRSLAGGKPADLLNFDALSSSMVCGAQHNSVPMTALKSSRPVDIAMTIVDFVVYTANLKLFDYDLAHSAERFVLHDKIMFAWADVIVGLLRQEMGC